MATATAQLNRLMSEARAASPATRIEWRDRIGAFGDAATEALTPWLSDPTLRTFAVRAMGLAAHHGGRDEAVAALQAALRGATDHFGRDIEEQLLALGVRPQRARPSRRRTTTTRRAATASEADTPA